MQQRPPVKVALLALAFALTIAACGSSDDSEASDPAESSTDSGETASSDTGDATTGESEPDDAGDEGEAGAAVAVGSGTLTIDGVENPGFEGECEISRANGAEPVGDVSTGELDTNVGMDNVASNPAQEMNFSITFGTLFSIRETDAAPTNGTVDSIAYVGEPSGDAAVIAFTGTTEDGRAIVAEVGCSLYEI
jgi:hypothetical protein